MSSIKPPPLYDGMVDPQTGKAVISWSLYFDSLFKGDTGTDWAPTFTSLTETGTPVITGRVYQLTRSIAFFRVNIIPATDTSSIAGTTYINNFPLIMSADGICFAVSGLLGTNSGACDSATNRIYVPAWTTVSVPLTVIGIVEAS